MHHTIQTFVPATMQLATTVCGSSRVPVRIDGSAVAVEGPKAVPRVANAITKSWHMLQRTL